MLNPKSQNSKPKSFGYRLFGHWLLFGIWCLVIGIYANVYASNLDKVKVCFLAGDYKSAISEGEKILAGSPEHAAGLEELYYILSLSYLKDGNYLRASDIFEIILKEFKDSDFTEEAKLGLGDACFLRGDYDNAGIHYQELIDNNSGTKLKAQVYYRLSQVGFKKGNAQQGKEYLERLKKEFPLNTELILSRELGVLPDYLSDFFYSVQVGSFAEPRNARNLTDKLSKSGYDAHIEETDLRGAKTYRVKVGRLKSRAEAVQLQNKLAQEGYPTKICP